MEMIKEKTAIEALSENVLAARFEDIETRIVEVASSVEPTRQATRGF
jgi:hypothetical protein